MARGCGIIREFVNDGGEGYHKFLNTKSLKLDLTIIDLLPSRPLKPSLGNEPFMDEMTDSLKGMLNWNAVRPDGLLAKLLKIDHPAFAQCFHSILVNVWVTGEKPPSNGNMRSSRSSTKRRTELTATTTEGLRLSPTQAKFC